MSEKERQELEQAKKADTKRILTLPNILSFVRLALIPVIILLYVKEQYWWAFGVLGLSGVTDVVDGWIARTFHLVSDFGKALDPIADKMTQAAVLLCLLPIKFWWVVGILAFKEITIGVMTLIAMRRMHSVYSAGWYGKLCTIMIYLSMAVLILWRDAPQSFVLIDCIVCSALILLAFSLYFIRYTAILREGKNENTEGSL